MKKIFSVLCLAICLFAFAVPASVSHAEDLRSVLSVSGTGASTAVPDRAIISIGVVSYEKDAFKAQQDNAVKSKQVQDALMNLGISAKDIQTENYSFNPTTVRDESNNQQRITGYNVNNTVVVVVEDTSIVGKVIDSALANGANKINSLRFSVKNTDNLRKAALQNAIKDARAKAEIIAGGLGSRIVGIKNVSESVSGVSSRDFSNVMLMKSVGEATPVSAGSLELEANVNIEFVIE